MKKIYENNDELRDMVMKSNFNKLKEYRKSLLDERDRFIDMIASLNKSEKTFRNYNISYDEDAFNKEISELKNAKSYYETLVDILKTYINEKQSMCEHKHTVYEGHDSHYTYEICINCGKEFKY